MVSERQFPPVIKSQRGSGGTLQPDNHPSIVMMEIRYLYQHKRIPLSFENVLQQVETCGNILLYPLDISVVTISPTTLDIHDAIIVGTALQAAEEFGQPATLVTVDKAITDSRLVPIIW